jgi:hypothetical protein
MSFRIAITGFFGTVLALGLLSCGSEAIVPQINERAAVAGHLPWNPLAWQVITSSVDQRSSSMSTLYGNDVAVRCARSGRQDYPIGSVISLVTWMQQDDVRWFGARIPKQVQSVEFVSVTEAPNHQPVYSYETYSGSPLTKTSASDGDLPASRVAYLLTMRAAVMP